MGAPPWGICIPQDVPDILLYNTLESATNGFTLRKLHEEVVEASFTRLSQLEPLTNENGAVPPGT